MTNECHGHEVLSGCSPDHDLCIEDLESHGPINRSEIQGRNGFGSISLSHVCDPPPFLPRPWLSSPPVTTFSTFSKLIHSLQKSIFNLLLIILSSSSVEYSAKTVTNTSSSPRKTANPAASPGPLIGTYISEATPPRQPFYPLLSFFCAKYPPPTFLLQEKTLDGHQGKWHISLRPRRP